MIEMFFSAVMFMLALSAAGLMFISGIVAFIFESIVSLLTHIIYYAGKTMERVVKWLKRYLR